MKRKTLDNGLTVLHEKRSYPATTVILATRYGAAYETTKEKGVAHFFEHLCFKGTKKRKTPKQIAYTLEKVGGDLNAFTDEEETAYYAKVPSDELKIAMDVIFDIYFNPTFPAKEFQKEANVICQEIRRSKDNPLVYVVRKLKSCLYRKPFGMPVLGTEENVKSMTRKKLLKMHREVHTPQNSILSIVGNNDLEEIVELSERFSVSRKGKKRKVPKKVKQTLKKKETRSGIQQATLALGFHFPTAASDEKYAAKLFSSILGGGMSSKLFIEVREKRGLAYAIGSSLDLGKDFGYLMIYAGINKDKVDEVREICIDEFKKMRAISKKTLKDAKRQLIGNNKIARESSSAVAMGMIYREIAGRSDPRSYAEKIQSVSLDDVVKLAKIKNYACFALTP